MQYLQMLKGSQIQTLKEEKNLSWSKMIVPQRIYDTACENFHWDHDKQGIKMLSKAGQGETLLKFDKGWN